MILTLVIDIVVRLNLRRTRTNERINYYHWNYFIRVCNIWNDDWLRWRDAANGVGRTNHRISEVTLMKNLITSLASIILFSMCLMQFAAQTVTDFEVNAVERTISHYSSKLASEDVFKEDISDSLRDFRNVEIDSVEAANDKGKLRVNYRIKNVVGPSRMVKQIENYATFTSLAYLKHEDKGNPVDNPSTGGQSLTPTDLPTNTDVDQGTP